MGKVNDSINLVRHLNVVRFFNLFGLKFSYLFSKVTKKSRLYGSPFSMSIEPTTACNLGCPECPSGLKQFTRKTGKLNLDFHENFLKQISKTVFYINYYFQGEPFLHPNFLELIKSAKKHKIYTATSTNAHFITEKNADEIVESGLDRLIISIDGLTQETYEQYRKQGSLESVLKGAELVISAKKRLNSKTPFIIFQFLAVKPNEHEIPQVHILGKEMGADEVRIKTAQLYDYKHGNPLMPNQEKYARYKKNIDGTYRLKYKTGNYCWRMWSSSVVTWDGNVVPCCFDKDATHVLGDVKADSFKVIWNSKEYRNFRNAILSNRNEIDICKNCSEGAKVWG